MTLHETLPSRVTPGRILDLEWGFAKSAALMAALETGVFDHVAGGADTPKALATAAELSQRGATSILQAMAALGLMTAEGDRYVLAPDSERFLIRGKPDYLGDMHLIFSGMNAALWPKLAQALRSGRPVKDFFTADDSSHWEAVFPFLEAVCRPMAAAVSAFVAASPESHPRFLDVGCGTGLYSRAVAEACPAARLTCVDQDEMHPCLESALAGPIGTGRVRLCCGNLFEVDWGKGHDIVLFSHLLHGFAIPECRQLMAKAHAALRPGGTLLIHEFVPDPQAPERTPIPALFSLEMLMTSHGDAYPASVYDDLLAKAGFSRSERLEGPRGATQILTATRKARSREAV